MIKSSCKRNFGTCGIGGCFRKTVASFVVTSASSGSSGCFISSGVRHGIDSYRSESLLLEGYINIIAKECVESFPFGVLMSASKLSTSICTNPFSTFEIPCTVQIELLSAATAADFLKYETSS